MGKTPLARRADNLLCAREPGFVTLTSSPATHMREMKDRAKSCAQSGSLHSENFQVLPAEEFPAGHNVNPSRRNRVFRTASASSSV